MSDGEVVVVFIRRVRVSGVLSRYIGLFGEAGVEELKKYDEEAQIQ